MSPRPSSRLTVCLVALTLWWTACSSSPDIPDENESLEPLDYASVDGEDNAGNKGSGEASGTRTSEGAGGSSQGTVNAMGGQAAAATPTSAKPPKAVGPVALIDGKPIAAEEFNREIDRVMASGQLPPQYIGQLKDMVVSRLIDKVLIERALSKSGVKVSKKEIDAKYREVQEELKRASAQSGGQVADLNTLKAKMGMSDKELRDSLEQSIAIEKLLAKRGMKALSDAEIKSFYERNKERFRQAERMRASHILLKVAPEADEKQWKAAEKKAKALHAKATSGEDFAALAKGSSDDAVSAKKGGDLGYFQRQDMVKSFAEAAFSLKAGDISKPVRTQYGWHIIKATERPKSKIDFETIKSDLRRQLEAQAMRAELVKLMQTLRMQAKIVPQPQNIK